ncbi:MAG TPA: AAA family ATPase [Gaiellaceae bacterium]|nr:AAA family ATPase [Gaiellaceae bacterium]
MSREERKVVTVLFTDLVGFTSRAEELDPEDVRAMLTPYYARLREQIEQRGGTVEKFIGDAVMAVFGAPVAHEDDPVRAVLTAIAIRDGSPDLEIRTAVNTGEALVALEADVSAGEALVSGDVVNTAARLQSAAPVNGILVGEATYRATHHVIDYADAPAVEAKGKAKPVPVWEVVAAHSRFGTDVEQTHRTALVGRERELFLLTDAFQRSKTEETAQLVTLVGVPGIGKSRLVAELFSVLDADPDVYWWRQGRSLPYGESRSVWALGEIVKAQAGILESDDAETAQEKLAAICSDEWVLSHLRPLAGVAGEIDESRDRRVEAFSAWRRFFETLAEERPLVLVFEDLHWADDTLLDFVDHLAEWVSGVPMLLVATARPELLDRRPDWGGGKRNATTLSIGALSNDETAKLLPVMPASTQQLVLERADGNPLYAAEYARMLADHPGEDLPLPETVQGVIAARIDALAAEEKALVQDASVLGKVFWPSALESANEAALHALERKEFIRRDRRSSVGGETQYAFLHLLVRDVAYGQIPRARRMEKHRAAAGWIASLSPDRSEDRAEMLAHHYREALTLAEAAGVDPTPLRAPALAALVEASERAAALSSWAAARDLAAEALVLAEEGDRRRAELQLRLARAKAYGFGEWDFELAEAARDWYVAEGQTAQAAESEAFLSWMHWWRADGTKAREHAQRALDLAANLPTSLSKARAYAQAARLHGIGGDPPYAIALADETLAMALELGREDIQSSALNSRGIAKGKVADTTCLDDLERSIELADRSNSPHEISTSRNNYGSLLSGLGRVAEADAIWEENVGASLRQGYPAGALWSEMALIVHRIPAGELARLLEMVDDMEPRVTPGTQPQNALQVVRSWVLAARGDTDGAIRILEKAHAFALQIRDAQAIAPVLSTKGFAFFLAGRHDEADAAMDEFFTTHANLGMLGSTSDLLLVLVERARIDQWVAAIGDSFPESHWVKAGMAAAAGDLVGAAEIYRGMGASFLEAWARLIAADRGDLSQLEPARAFFAGVGATPFVRRCETILSASA